MHYIYSTLTCDNAYTIYDLDHKSKDIPKILRKILIKGGCGVATKHLFTPKGIMTQVSDEDLALLEKDSNFINHRDNGFIHVEKRNIDIEKAIKNMAPKDGSAPKTPADYKQSDKSDETTKIYKAKSVGDE